MNDIQAAYVKIARNRDWKMVADVKEFDLEQTSIVRVFKHEGAGHYAVYAAHSVDGKNVNARLEIAVAGVGEVVKRVAADAGCVLKAGVAAAAAVA